MKKFSFALLALFFCFLLLAMTKDSAIPDPHIPAPWILTECETGEWLEARANGKPVSDVVTRMPLPNQDDHGISPDNLDDGGLNVKCNQDGGASRQNEISIAANPGNNLILLSGSNDYRNGDASGGFYRSLNGGASWNDALVTRGPAGVFDAAGDPVCNIDSTGRMYACYIAFDRGTTDNGIYVQTSINNGSTWSAPVGVVTHTLGGDQEFEDKPYGACDFSTDSPYRGNYYLTWTKFTLTNISPIYFSRSTNGGATFSAPIQISDGVNCQFSCPIVGPNGEIYVTWNDYDLATVQIDVSTDGGLTWGTDQTVTSFNFGELGNPCGGYRIDSYGAVACDISTGPRRGWLYVANLVTGAVDNNLDILFTRSSDGGSSWSAPARLNDDATTNWQYQPWICCNPVNGALGATWMDAREDANNCNYKVYGATSVNGGTTWSPNFTISTQTSNPSTQNFLGDYATCTFFTTGFIAGWTDLRNGNQDCFSGKFDADIAPACMPTSSFSQMVSLPNAPLPPNFQTSESTSNVAMFEKFTNVNQSIGKVRFWGLQYWDNSPDSNYYCTDSPQLFDVKFYPDSSNFPTSTPAATYLGVTASEIVQSDLYTVGTALLPRSEFELTLSPVLYLAGGWISIVGQGQANCKFHWLSSIDGDVRCVRKPISGGVSTVFSYDLSVCFSGPCDAPDSLTIQVQSGPQQTLRFYAPTSGYYALWSSTSPNNDGNPDNGSDPAWTREAVLFASGAGNLSYNEPAGSSGIYKNFAANHLCGITNDYCAYARTISEGTYSFSSSNMTTDTISCTCPITRDVWYEYIAACTGTATVSSCLFTNINTVYAAYSGTCPNLTQIVCNDNFCGNRAQISFPVISGNRYFLRIGVAGGISITTSFTVSCS